MKKAVIHLANGFEEVEAVTPIDVLRRAGCEVTVVSVTGSREVNSSRGLTIVADLLFEQMNYADADIIIFPGGQPGSDNLNKHEGVKELIRNFNARGKMIAAICAAPMILSMADIIQGKRVTCFPGVESKLKGAICTGNAVETDGNIITGKAAGSAMKFSLLLAEKLIHKNKAEELKKNMCVE
jgi:protein deglycase